MLEAVRSSETSVYLETIRRYTPEGCHLKLLLMYLYPVPYGATVLEEP
jgi:hypothetical protein